MSLNMGWIEVLHFQTRTLPTVSRIRGLLDARRIVDDPVSVLAEYTVRLGDTFNYSFGGANRILVTSRPSIINHVLKARPESFFKSEIQTKRMTEFLGKGLLTLGGEEWRRRRRHIQSGLGGGSLEALTPTLHRCLSERLQNFADAADAGPVNVPSAMMKLTFAMVGQSMFGADFPQEDMERVSETIGTVQSFMVRRTMQPYLTPWFILSGAVRRHQEMRRAGDAVLERYLAARRQTAAPSNDLLNVLMNTRDPDTGEGLSADEILKESMQLLVAAHETSSTVLGWTFYLLARHPDVLARVRSELAEVVGDGPLQYKDVNKLSYSQAVLKETMRLYPAFWMIDRLALEDSEVDGVPLPAGTRIAVFVYGAHRNPQAWNEPVLFRPERFFGEEKANQRNGAYIPFGAGPRTCIGWVYAMLQMLLVLSEVLRRYDFELAESGPVEPKALFILRSAHGISMRFSSRPAS